jgi:hypothetical protein
VPASAISEPLKLGGVKAADLISAASSNYMFQNIGKDTVVLKNTMPSHAMTIHPDAWTRSDMVDAAQQLKLKPCGPYRFVPNYGGQIKRNLDGAGDEIIVGTRSVLGAMLYLSRGVSVPEKHYKQGLVVAPTDQAGQPFDWSQMTDGLFRVCVQKIRPAHAFVSVKYRGYWFYISDDDRSSKSTFNLMLEMHNVQITQGLTAPVLTIPVSGKGGKGD